MWNSEPVHVLHPTHVTHRGISSGSMYKSMDASSSSARNLAERQHYEAFFNEYGGVPTKAAHANQQNQGGQQPRSAAATAIVREERQLAPRVDADVAANRTAVVHISWDPVREEGSLFEVQTKGGRDRTWRTAWVGSLTFCKLSGLLQVHITINFPCNFSLHLPLSCLASVGHGRCACENTRCKSRARNRERGLKYLKSNLFAHREK